MPRLTMQDIRELQKAIAAENYGLLAERHAPAMADAIEALVQVARELKASGESMSADPYKALRDFLAGEFAGLLEPETASGRKGKG